MSKLSFNPAYAYFRRFTLRFVVFFAVFFAFFAFLAIAALLAMLRWRCRNSAAANRRALHSDYYKTMQKTATPLNEVCTAPMNRASQHAQTTRRALICQCMSRFAHQRRSKFQAPQKSLRHSAF